MKDYNDREENTIDRYNPRTISECYLTKQPENHVDHEQQFSIAVRRNIYTVRLDRSEIIYFHPSS